MADRHPTPEELYRARRGPRGATAEAHLAHAAACAVCTEELARLEAFDRPEAMEPGRLDAAWERFTRAEEPPALSPRRSAGPRRLALALAAVLAACVVGLLLFSSTRTLAPPPADTGAIRGGAERAGLWSPEGSLPKAPASFIFPVTDGAPRRVTVYDAAGAYRWTSEPATGGRIPLPTAEQQRLEPGVDYFWTVLDGAEVVAARRFRVGGPEGLR